MTMSSDSVKFCLHLDGSPLNVIFLTMEAAEKGATRFVSIGRKVEIQASSTCGRGCLHGWRYALLRKNPSEAGFARDAANHTQAVAVHPEAMSSIAGSNECHR